MMQQEVLNKTIYKNDVFSDLADRLRDFRIIDCHLHLGYLSSLNFPGVSDGYMIDLLKKYGVEKAVFAHHGALSAFASGMKKTLDALEKYRGLLLAYLVFNPNYSEESLNIIKSFRDDKRFVGVKIHPSWHACYPYDGKYKEFWQYADDSGLVVLTHSWNPDVANKAQRFSDPFFFGPIVEKYHNLKLILAHAGGRGEYLYRVIDLLDKNENLYVDFAGDIFVPGLIEEYVSRLGSERLLFGTDMPWIDIRFHLSNIMASNIGEADKANILGLNAIRLFNI